jgi:nitrite reductase (NO-forming)
VGWHGVSLVAQLRRALGSRFSVTVRFYVAAASLLPVGALLGVLMARGATDGTHARLMVAHVAVNVLGWMGLTVVGTLLTLWPTMLRTRIVAGAELAARRALPLLVGAVLVTVAGCLTDLRPVAAAGLAAYVVGLGLVAGPFLGAARAKPPTHFATWSVAAAVCWLAGSVAVMAAGVLLADSWHAAHEAVGRLTPALGVGFGAQVLLGALSYLLPVSVGGGPAGTRAANAVLDRGGALRISLTNAGLALCLLPVPSLVRVLLSVMVLGALVTFLPLMFLSTRAARTARTLAASARPRPRPRGPVAVAGDRPPGQRTGMAVVGLALVMLAVAVGVAVDPAARAGAEQRSAAAGVAATGATTKVVVEAKDMRFTPAQIRVPAGNRLVIDLRNTDAREVHDLVLDSGADSGRLAPGERATVEVGVVGRDLSGWCSIVGHKQMGMVFAVEVTGRADRGGHAHDHTAGQSPAHGPATHQAAAPDLMATPAHGFRARDARLTPAPSGTVHRRTLTVTEAVHEVSPGVEQRLWTFGGSMPGPVLHGRVGDVFEITLLNRGTMGHSVDFHAGVRAPDQVMRTIPPGESLVYRFRAERAGIWMYHCSTMPMSAHIANGMFGAVVIEPRDLPRVDRSYVLVQSELYLGARGEPVDVAKVRAERPDLVVFNGYANQYDHRPLRARTGERVRLWVLAAGPNRGSSFHVVGGQFDTVWSEGAYLLRRGGDGGSQVLGLQPAQGGFVELTFPEPGRYPFVTHRMVDAERGAHGVLEVTR